MTYKVDRCTSQDKSVITNFVATLLKDNKDKICEENSDSIPSSDDDNAGYFTELQQLLSTSESSIKTSDNSDIQLNMRPTLPRRQFEVPRFSPVAAWRTLSGATTDDQHQTDKNNISVATTIFREFNTAKRPIKEKNLEIQTNENLENEIVYRESILPRFMLDNKSEDSYMLANDGLQIDLNIKNHTQDLTSINDKVPLTWTPQQDLDEDSITSEENENQITNGSDNQLSTEFLPSKYSSHGHIFSLSLPRESHLSAYNQIRDKPQLFNSLQKLKRSVTGAFGTATEISNTLSPIVPRNDNWVLTSSISNSIEKNMFSPMLSSSQSFTKHGFKNDFINGDANNKDDYDEYDDEDDTAKDSQTNDCINGHNNSIVFNHNIVKNVIVHKDANIKQDINIVDKPNDDKTEANQGQIVDKMTLSYAPINNYSRSTLTKNNNDNNMFKQRQRPRQQKTANIQPPSFNYLSGGKHVMYLPNNNKNLSMDNFMVNNLTSPLCSLNSSYRIVHPQPSSPLNLTPPTSPPPQPPPLPRESERQNLQDVFNYTVRSLMCTYNHFYILN